MTAPHFRRGRAVVALVACAGALAGCLGGGGDDSPPAPAPTAAVPASASQSVGGFIAYLMALIASPADTLEPVDVSSVTPPTDDTAEPTPIN